MRQLRSCACLVTLGLLATLSPAWAQADFEWEGTLGAGKSLEIKGINGRVEASLAPGSQAVVEAFKSAEKGDPDLVKIVAVEHANGVTICAVYPTPKGKKPNECAPGKDGRMQVKDNDTEVRFTVRVPRGIRFIGRTVNGDVQATGLEGDVVAKTVNGNVEVRTTGAATAHTVNGSIQATMGRVGSDASFQTVNGGITVALPEGVGLDLEAATVNGDISSDFPITREGDSNRNRWGPKRIRGTIGGGGISLELKTVNGSIELTRAS